MMIKVRGFCPMGCGETLFVVNHRVSNHRVECCNEGCPRPAAAAEILNDPETEHIVEVDAVGFCLQHPLRERLDGDLFGCTLHDQLVAKAGPTGPTGLVEPGRYRVTADPAADGLLYEPVVPAEWEREQLDEAAEAGADRG